MKVFELKLIDFYGVQIYTHWDIPVMCTQIIKSRFDRLPNKVYLTISSKPFKGSVKAEFIHGKIFFPNVKFRNKINKALGAPNMIRYPVLAGLGRLIRQSKVNREEFYIKLSLYKTREQIATELCQDCMRRDRCIVRRAVLDKNKQYSNEECFSIISECQRRET